MALFFLTPGRLETPTIAVKPGGGFNNIMLPTAVAVLIRPDDSVVLVDAGFSRDEMDDPKAHLGRIRHLFFRIHGNGDQSIVAQLERKGISADRVTTIVATHLHMDHIGAFVDFPNAEVVATDKEFAGARARGKWAGFLNVDGLIQSGRARPVHLDNAARYGFPDHKDLFGDGTVLLLDARGHTAGSMAVLLTEPQTGKSVLMAGDAAYSPEEYRNGQISWLARITAFRQEWLRATWACLNNFENIHAHSPVVLSHDPSCFSTLPQEY